MMPAIQKMPRDASSAKVHLHGTALTNAMTVDVEDYFQVSLFERHVDRAEWDNIPCRIVENTEKILGIFSRHGVSATFFMLGWVAERFPMLTRRIVEEGHELASHGYSHVRVFHQGRKEFREDVLRTKRILEDLGGTEVKGYRAASYSISKETPWAYEVLQEAGYRYSSSIYPIRHDLYGMPQAPRFAFHPDGKDGVLEFPVTTAMIGGQRMPCGGGGYFRFYPYVLSKWAMKQVNKCEGHPCIFYFHPWELDPGQPRQAGLPFKTRFRHYLNLSRMETRLDRLLKDFSWDRMDQVFSGYLATS